MYKLNTLVIYSNGFREVDKITNTLIRGILNVNYNYKPPEILKKIPLLNKIFNYILNPYEFQSYLNDWKEALTSNSQLKVDLCNIQNIFELKFINKNISNYDLIIILHSALGDNLKPIEQHANQLLKRKSKVAVFVGNEYDLMFEKINFLKKIKANIICTQLPIETAKWIYSDCVDSEIAEMPHALNENLYRHDSKILKKYDIGFRGVKYPIFIGDNERNSFIDFFIEKSKKYNLKLDIDAGNQKNLPRSEWALFLNQCNGTIGAEAGTYYLDKHGELINEAKYFLKNNSNIDVDKYFEDFFCKKTIIYRTGKAISSRHFEPMGTKTCQILLEGEYNGILKNDIHYISVKKDYSNFEDAILKFKDETFRNYITENAYNHVIKNHTYEKRVSKLISLVKQ